LSTRSVLEITGEKTAEHLLLFCPQSAVERQQYVGDSTNVSDVFRDSDVLVEFLISLEHLLVLPPHPYIGSAWRARHANNNNKVKTSA